MEVWLRADVMYKVLDLCACIGDKDLSEKSEKYSKDMSVKKLKEKVNHLGKLHHDFEKTTLNNDKTLTTIMVPAMNKGKYICLCRSMD
jgi:hypothetical protein